MSPQRSHTWTAWRERLLVVSESEIQVSKELPNAGDLKMWNGFKHRGLTKSQHTSLA